MKNDSTQLEMISDHTTLRNFSYLYYDQSGFEIQPLSPLFLREDLGEFLKLENLKTTFTLVYYTKGFGKNAMVFTLSFLKWESKFRF